MSAPPRLRALVLLAVGVTCWTALAHGVRASHSGRLTADEPHYLLTATSLGEDFDLDVSDERATGRYRAYHEAAVPVQEAVRDDGSEVAPHDPLLPALLATPMRVGGWRAAKLALAALAGGLAALTVWVATRRFEVPPTLAMVTVAAFAVAAPLGVYATQVYPEVPAALAVAVGIAALTGPLRRWGLVAAGAAMVALPWLSVKYAPVAAVLAVLACFVLWRAGRRRDAAVFVAALGAAGIVFALAHLRWYGGLTPYASGSHFTAGEFSVVGDDPDYVGRATRLVGLLVDRDFGLAAWHPLFLLGVPAIAALVARRPRGWAVLVLPWAAGWLNATFVALTMHGWWFPGRQVVVVLPCVVLAVAWWVARARVPLSVVAALGALGASVLAWLVAEAWLDRLTLVVTFESTTHPVLWLWRALLPDYRDATRFDWMLHAGWLAAIGGLAWLGIRSVPPEGGTHGPTPDPGAAEHAGATARGVR